MTRLILLISLFLSPWANAGQATALFAGGCFWCMESDYQELDGVTDVVSGFTGGTLENPTYSGNHEGHYEAVKITYDPEVISYAELVDRFWRSIDPFDNKGQFCDKGFSYRTALFPATAGERAIAEASLAKVAERFPQETVHTEIRDASAFWPVEDYHQDYYLKNPVRYKFYRWNCGRDQRLDAIWGDEARGGAEPH